MALNSLDVQNKTFNLQFRGYHKQEVDEFLQIIVNDYDEMSQKIKDNEREIKTLTERLRDFDNMKDSLNKSIIVAQDTADNMKNQAEADATRVIREGKQKSDLILDAAQREARQVLQSTYDEARRLVNESDGLKRGMRSYYQRITMLIEGQLANIKSTEWEETLKPSPIYVGDSEEKLREIIEHTNQAFSPINENGEEIENREGTAPETLETFANALNPQQETPQSISPQQEETSEPPAQPIKGGKVDLSQNLHFGSNS
jgi:cell division initiation protein